MYIKSPLNYVGGKTKLLPQILPLFPKNINTFVDLFCGGCNVGVNVEAKHKVFNDLTTPVIDIYRYIQSKPTVSIIENIYTVIEKYKLSLTNEDGYNKMRNNYNKSKEPLLLLCLIFYSFNHQFRFNSKGGFNMPFGKNRSHFNATIEKNLVAFKPCLDDVVFSTFDFSIFDVDSLTENDFVYIDPPYLISTATYNASWNETHEQLLLDLMVRLDNNSVKFALSNVLFHKGLENTQLSDFVTKHNFKCHRLDFNYKNSSYHGENLTEKTVEILLTNY
jgi:DNA adenine methylase